MKRTAWTATAGMFIVAVILSFAIYPCFDVALAWELDRRHTDINGNPTIDWGPSKQERQQQQEREIKQRQSEEAAAEAAKDRQTETAYAKSRREKIAKSKRRAKSEGHKKSYNSWQLQHR